MHEPDRERIARQEHELDEPVHVALAEIPVARDVEIVAAVQPGRPEAQHIGKGCGIAQKPPQRPDAEQHERVKDKQRGENARRGLRVPHGRGGEAVLSLPAPEAHPFRHEAQPQRGKAQRAQPRGGIAPEPVMRAAQPEPEARRKRQQRRERNISPRCAEVDLFHG